MSIHTGYADIVIITALRVEFNALLNILESPVELPGENVQYRGTIKVSPTESITVIICNTLRTGMTDTAITATKLISKWKPEIVAMAGIAAGVDRKTQNCGDIIVVTEAFDYGAGKWTYSGFSTDYRFLSLDSLLETHVLRTRDSDLLDIYNKCSELNKPSGSSLQLHIGPMGSGAAVIARKSIIKDARQNNRKLKGVDMEAYAVFKAVHGASEPRPKAFVVKSISDFGDSSKSDEYHNYAAKTSAEYLVLIMQRYFDKPRVRRTPTGLLDHYFRSDMSGNHPPLSSARNTICLIGGSLRKYGLEIREIARADLMIKVVLPDPQNELLINEWMRVIPESPDQYCNDVVYTLQNLKAVDNKNQLRTSLTSRLHITTACILDDEMVIVEVNSFKCPGQERLLLEIEKSSKLGETVKSSFDSLFLQGRRLQSDEDYDTAIEDWNNLPAVVMSRDLKTLEAKKIDNNQFASRKKQPPSNQIWNWLEGGEPTPISLELDITLSCNDHCPNCTCGFAHKQKSLTFSQIDNILKEASEIGIQGITLTGGGDPLQHNDIIPVLRTIKQYGFIAGLFTNGGMINNEEIAHELLDSLEWIRISLDSASEAHFRRMHGHGGYDERIEQIGQLKRIRKESRQCELGVSFLTCSETADDIFSAAQTTRALGFDYIQFKPMIDWRGKDYHSSSIFGQSGVFSEIRKALELQNSCFRVLVSFEKYRPEILNKERVYSAFHNAWFVVTVGPNLSGPEVKPTLYLDCSSKYIDKWTIGEFGSLSEALKLPKRRVLIESTSSDVYCVPSEKHAVYNHLLEALLRKHYRDPFKFSEINSHGENSLFLNGVLRGNALKSSIFFKEVPMPPELIRGRKGKLLK